MNEIQAKDLVKKLVQAAFNAGKHSAHPEGLMAKSETKKAMDLGNKIVRHLTSGLSRHLTRWFWCSWQHEETGRICIRPLWKPPGRRWYKYRCRT